jgi:hypothetical protein
MTLTTDESILYQMSRGDLARHGRAVQQYSDAADRDLYQFTVHVLMLSSRAARQKVMRAAAAAGMIDRCREIFAALQRADEISRAYSETLRRRGISGSK